MKVHGRDTIEQWGQEVCACLHCQNERRKVLLRLIELHRARMKNVLNSLRRGYYYVDALGYLKAHESAVRIENWFEQRRAYLVKALFDHDHGPTQRELPWR